MLRRRSRRRYDAPFAKAMSDPQELPEPQPRQPGLRAIEATIALLGAGRDPAVRAARERLLRWGELALEPLRRAAEAESMRLRLRARGVLRTLEVRDCLRRFAALRLGRNGRSHAPSLLEGATLLAQMVRTFVPEAPTVAAPLRAIAAELRQRCTGHSLPFVARELAKSMGEGLALQGKHADARELDHLLLDRVLMHGTGMPVALSLLYLLVARWAGFSAVGVALPGHFLVRLHGPRPVLVEPAQGGRAVTKADCLRHLRDRGTPAPADQLRDLTDREVLVHYLRALQVASAVRPQAETQQTLDRALLLLEAI
jgi:regulator of sirC expression with transglutaminase-like and TPR domain